MAVSPRPPRSPRGKPISEEERRARALARYYRRIETGKCATCGKNPPQVGRTQCTACALAGTQRSLSAYYLRRNERLTKGVCVHCGKEPPKPGRMTCQACLDYAAAVRAARLSRA